jgi:hypothetical protein
MPNAKMMFASQKPIPRGQALVIGGLCFAVGGFIAAVALRWIPAPAESFHAPREVVLCAGMLFALAGTALASNGRLPAWVNSMMGACIWTAFAAIPSWIAWGAGPRQFSGDGLWLLALVGLDFQSLGRTLFGLSALLMWLCAFGAWWMWLKALPAPGRGAALVALVAVAAWLGWFRYQEPAWPAGEAEAERLARYIVAKHADPDFIEDPQNPYLRPVAETWIKKSRARLAASRQAPRGVRVAELPRSRRAPTLDGVVNADEWSEALRFAANGYRGAFVLIMVHAGKLYAAGVAPKDRTKEGFDQFRFYYDLGLAPAFGNERVFVSGNGSATTLRSVYLPGKKYDQSEWGVLDGVVSASTLKDHRQFEVEIDLTEAGLPPGTAFPFFAEVEGDPLRTPKGKFKARVIEGRVGSYTAPLWARVPHH